MATILLVRHGETDWNRSGQIMGERPIPLNREGEAQAQRLAATLKGQPIRAIFASPAVRTAQTAEILASTLRVSVITDPGLTEIGVGRWEGLYWKDLADDLVRQNYYSNPADARPPDGETLREVQTRAVASIERAQTLGTDPLLFVSHADVVRVILAHYLGFDLQRVRQLRIDHASLSALRIDGDSVDLLCLNYPPILDMLWPNL